MKNYPQLTQEERYQIHMLMKANYSLSEIANNLGRSKSTISREVRRNKGRGLSPETGASTGSGTSPRSVRSAGRDLAMG